MIALLKKMLGDEVEHMNLSTINLMDGTVADLGLWMIGYDITDARLQRRYNTPSGFNDQRKSLRLGIWIGVAYVDFGRGGDDHWDCICAV